MARLMTGSAKQSTSPQDSRRATSSGRLRQHGHWSAGDGGGSWRRFMAGSGNLAEPARKRH